MATPVFSFWKRIRKYCGQKVTIMEFYDNGETFGIEESS